MVRVGDRVRVGTWDFPIFVERIYFIDNDDNECFEFEAATTMLLLNWGKQGKSRVALHDEGKYWSKYFDLN